MDKDNDAPTADVISLVDVAKKHGEDYQADTFENLTKWDVRLMTMAVKLTTYEGDEDDLNFVLLDMVAGWRDEDQEED